MTSLSFFISLAVTTPNSAILTPPAEFTAATAPHLGET